MSNKSLINKHTCLKWTFRWCKMLTAVAAFLQSRVCSCSDLFRFMSHQSVPISRRCASEKKAERRALPLADAQRICIFRSVQHNVQTSKNALIDNAISHFTTKGFGFVSVELRQRKRRKKTLRWFWAASLYYMQLIVDVLRQAWTLFTQLSISCKPFGLNIIMNFIASIKGHKDDRLKFSFESRLFFVAFFVRLVHKLGCNQTIYKTYCVRSLKKLTQPIKSCILRLSSRERKKTLSEYHMNVWLWSSAAFDFVFCFSSYGRLWFGKSFQHFFRFSLFAQANTQTQRNWHHGMMRLFLLWLVTAWQTIR